MYMYQGNVYGRTMFQYETCETQGTRRLAAKRLIRHFAWWGLGTVAGKWPFPVTSTFSRWKWIISTSYPSSMAASWAKTSQHSRKPKSTLYMRGKMSILILTQGGGWVCVMKSNNLQEFGVSLFQFCIYVLFIVLFYYWCVENCRQWTVHVHSYDYWKSFTHERSEI